MKTLDFHLSRVHAAGWNAARHFSTADGEPDAAAIDALNPHKKEPERARWLMGFRGARGAEKTK
jgi:hypothetical protein